MKQVWRPKLVAPSKIAEEEEDDYYHDRRQQQKEDKRQGHRHHHRNRNRNRRASQCNTHQQKLHDLPWEAICIIMSKLPIKSIFRFTPVSKSFNNFLQDPYFISLHSIPQPPNIIIFDNFDPTKFTILEKQPNDNHSWTSPTIIPIARELQDRYLGLGVVATCNGLLWLSDFSPTNLFFVIYNPVTRDLKTISKPPDEKRRYDVYCFGFDSKSKAYKLIVICTDFDGLLVATITTLGASVTSWRKLDLPAELDLTSIDRHQKPVFFNGKVYLIITSYLLVIDISKETCRLIDTTELSPSINIWNYNLYESGTHLTLLKLTKEVKTLQLVDSDRGIFGQEKGHDRIFQDYKVKFAGTVGNDKLLLRIFNDPVPAYTEGFYDDDGPYTLSTYDLKSGKLSRIYRSISNSYDALPFVASIAPLNF